MERSKGKFTLKADAKKVEREAESAKKKQREKSAYTKSRKRKKKRQSTKFFVLAKKLKIETFQLFVLSASLVKSTKDWQVKWRFSKLLSQYYVLKFDFYEMLEIYLL